MELGLHFIISQVLVFIAMFFDFGSMQFKERKHIYSLLTISAALISAHYFLLGKIAAGVIVFFSMLRFISCIFTTDKRVLWVFIILNTISFIFTYREIYDTIIYVSLLIFMVGNFQEDKKKMRKIMMTGTFITIIYNAIIFSPMGVVMEGSFFIGQLIGYYRNHMKNK